jgi:adenylate cyclase
MAKTTELLSVLFSDISGSSKLYELLGDQVAQKIIGKILDRLSDLTVQYSGKVIKTVGDAVVCTFNSADNAIGAAKAMQLTMTFGISDDANLPQINIHIGIHHGSVVINNDDIFGDAVNITARVADYANPRQIVATRAATDNLSEEASCFKKYLTRITAKNISGEIELFEINFEEQQSTLVLDTRKISEDLFCSSLYLTRGGQVIVLDVQKQVVSVGREEFNDIAV